MSKNTKKALFNARIRNVSVGQHEEHTQVLEPGRPAFIPSRFCSLMTV